MGAQAGTPMRGDIQDSEEGGEYGGVGRLVVGLELQGRMLYLLPLTCLPLICLALVYHLITPIATADITFADSGHRVFLVFIYLMHPQIPS